MRYPFTLYKVKSKAGIVWHARLWDEFLQKCALSRSTAILVERKNAAGKRQENYTMNLQEQKLQIQNHR